MDDSLNDRGISTRSRLQAIACKLFYDQGYTATTLAQISTQSGINNGLITYYFGTKNKLASEVYNHYLMNVRNEITRQLFQKKKIYSMELGIAVETRLLLEQKFKNPNLLRFCNEYQKASSHYTEHLELRDRYYALQKELINPEISDVDLQLYSVCGIAVIRSITEAFEHKYLECDIDYLEDYAIRALFRMLQLDTDRVEELVEESRIWEKQLNITVGPNFRLSSDDGSTEVFDEEG